MNNNFVLNMLFVCETFLGHSPAASDFGKIRLPDSMQDSNPSSIYFKMNPKKSRKFNIFTFSLKKYSGIFRRKWHKPHINTIIRSKYNMSEIKLIFPAKITVKNIHQEILKFGECR